MSITNVEGKVLGFDDVNISLQAAGDEMIVNSFKDTPVASTLYQGDNSSQTPIGMTPTPKNVGNNDTCSSSESSQEIGDYPQYAKFLAE